MKRYPIEKISYSEVKRKEYAVKIRCSIKDSRGIYHEGFGNSKEEALSKAKDSKETFYSRN